MPIKLAVPVGGISRSGKTLLASILASHPDINMAYELVPPKGVNLRFLRECYVNHNGNDKEYGHPYCRTLKKQFMLVGLGQDHIHKVLNEYLTRQKKDEIETQEDRFFLIKLIGETLCAFTGKEVFGFKESSGDFSNISKVFENVAHVILLRDPRAIYASQIRMQNRLNTGLSDMSKFFKSYGRILRLSKRGSNEGTCKIILYEDLVTQPEEASRKLCDYMGIHFSENMLHPERHSVFNKGEIKHVNASDIRSGIYTNGNKKWKKILSGEQQKEIEHQFQEYLELYWEN